MNYWCCQNGSIGDLMGIFNLFGKKDASSELTKPSPFRISTEWTPYSLYSNRNNSTILNIKLKNMTKETLLTSVVVELPQTLGFDTMGVSKEREVRVGELVADEEKDLGVEVYGGMKSDPGEYTVLLTAIAHYRDYGHVINAVKKRTTLKVV
ncbi:MAG: hypothetical protein M1528_03090 [Candidatus Marsarchaeota archaeon]|nr:hypothetical protein [Candidatus Marsarchaeota archaeon]MCL5115492.1 hypothetical protein [Candidatus Marsarchaeota archaeon]